MNLHFSSVKTVPTACLATLTLFAVASISGQGAVGPGILRAKRDTAGLSPARIGVTSVHQVHMVRPTGNPTGIWICAMTVSGLPLARGGRGGMDLLLGRYDPVQDVFVADLSGNSCNSYLNEFSGMLGANGLQMVFERFVGTKSTVYLTRRTATSLPFGRPMPLRGLPPQSDYDPSIGTVHGNTCLFFRLGNAIYYAKIDPQTLTVAPDRTLAVGPSRPGSTANSPTPIFDPVGEVTGLSHHDLLGSDNDQYISFDLDPFTPSLPFLDTNTWINNGGFTAGRFFTAESSPSPYHIVDLDTVWMSGTRTSIGGTAYIDFQAPPTSSGSPRFANLLLSGGFLSRGIKVPGIDHEFGLDATGLLLFQVGTIDPRSGHATLRLQIPNQLGLLGTSVPAQGLIVDSNGAIFTNTVRLEVDPTVSRKSIRFPYDGRDHLLSRINPELPTMVRSSAANPAPFTILAKDASGRVVPGSAILVHPGHTAALHFGGAVNYVVRMAQRAGAVAAAEENIGELVVDASSGAVCLCDGKKRHVYGTNRIGVYKIFVRAHDGAGHDSLCDLELTLEKDDGTVLVRKRVSAGGSLQWTYRKVNRDVVHFKIRCLPTGPARRCIYIVGIRYF